MIVGLSSSRQPNAVRVYKAIAKNKYTQMAQDFCSSATTAWMQEVEQGMEQLPRRKNGRIASYATIFATQETGKKTSQLGIFFARNHLS
ncbi:MAG: hypothetical protein EPN17_08895 [Methylobacter sp.]|nr:MAG: hypothetical protein EPN17_08895 [Methylobacter sp.]